LALAIVALRIAALMAEQMRMVVTPAVIDALTVGVDIPGENGRVLPVTSEEVEQELVRVAEQRVAHGH
jgi:hypothetical protein